MFILMVSKQSETTFLTESVVSAWSDSQIYWNHNRLWIPLHLNFEQSQNFWSWVSWFGVRPYWFKDKLNWSVDMVHWTYFDSAPSKYNLISIALYKQTALARLSIYCHDSMGQNRSKSSVHWSLETDFNPKVWSI